MKSLCPSCMLIGLVMLPFEIVARTFQRLVAGRTSHNDKTRFHIEP